MSFPSLSASAKRKPFFKITSEDIRVGQEQERETATICTSLIRKDVIHKLRDFLSERPATSYQNGEPILKKDGTPFRMRDIEHLISLQLDKNRTLRTPDGSAEITTSFGDTVPDGEIVEITSGTQGVVAPTVWEDNMISIHTHPVVPLDRKLKEKMKELKAKGKDTMDMYVESDNSLADPHILSGGDILTLLYRKVRAGCLAEVRKDKVGKEKMILKCYNLRCMYPSEQKQLQSMTGGLMDYENSLRRARASEFIGGGTSDEALIEWQLTQIEGLFRSIDFYNQNELFRNLYYSPDCKCEFRFDKS